MKRVAIDVGGTFTDCLVLDEKGAIREFKHATVPANPVEGVLGCLRMAAAHYRQPGLAEFLAGVDVIVHGTTLATNTLVTERGAQVGMITTENFRDIIEIRRGLRPHGASLYNVFVPPYRPLVPRYRRLGVAERTRYNGEILEPLDETATLRAAMQLKEQGVESVAVCFLHSYANPANEQRAAAICRQVFGPGRVTTSHEVLPVWREFERFSTTVVSAYLAPVVRDYLDSLERHLQEEGFGGTLLIMLTNGLVQTVDQCRDRAIYLLHSGPAAAPFGALRLAGSGPDANLLSIDVGGTSFDVCVIRGGQVPTTTENWSNDHRVAIRMVDEHSIGAGGGSIVWIDPLGLLRVGPQSAGADPGPACYGKGTEPTATDAALVLGYVPADNFLGGQILLDVERARQALETVARPLRMNVEQVAEAICQTINANMAHLITEVCTRRGIDVRDFTLVAGGGAGPVHAAAVAELLGLDTVYVPSVAAAYSAFGMLSMQIGRDYARSYPARKDQIEVGVVAQLYREMEDEARRHFAAMGVAAERIQFTPSAEMRYVGQFHEVEVPVAAGPVTQETLNAAVASLHVEHEKLYAFALPWKEAEFLTFRLRASAPNAEFHLRRVAAGDADAGHALARRRPCIWDGRTLDTPVYDGGKLLAGNRLAGPAIIEERSTTIVVPEGFSCSVDDLGTYRLQRRG